MLWAKSDNPDIKVPASTQKRARQVIQMGHVSTWVDQTLYLIGYNTTHHRHGDPLLDDAIQAAEALLALLVEQKRREQT